MALISAKVIAQVSCRSPSELAAMSWEWVMRADGRVLYRLTKVDGRRSRKQLPYWNELTPGHLQSFLASNANATAMLNSLARQHGHKIG